MSHFEQRNSSAQSVAQNATGSARPGRSSRTRAWIWTVSLALVPILTSFAAVLNPRWWRLLAVNHMQPYFLDLVAILAAGQTYAAGLNPYRVNPFDPQGRPHVYGPLWLGVGKLGLTVSDAAWLGVALAVLFTTVMAAVLAPRTKGSFAMAALLLASPPVLLALERGNNDLVVVLLLIAGAWTLARSGWIRFAGGAGCLLLAAALKIYPIAALPVLFGKRHTRATVLICVAAGIACVLGWWDWRNEYRSALTLAPQPTTISAYGLYVSYLTWNSMVATRAWLIAGALMGGGILLWAFRKRICDLWRAVPLAGFRAIAFIAGALPWVVCYLVASNYPYRFVLLLLPAALWLGQLRRKPLQAVARGQLVGWLVVAWLGVITRPLALKTLGPAPGSSPQWLMLVVGIEQTLVALLTVFLAVSVAGWFFRRGVRLLTDTKLRDSAARATP